MSFAFKLLHLLLVMASDVSEADDDVDNILENKRFFATVTLSPTLEVDDDLKKGEGDQYLINVNDQAPTIVAN